MKAIPYFIVLPVASYMSFDFPIFPIYGDRAIYFHTKQITRIPLNKYNPSIICKL